MIAAVHDDNLHGSDRAIGLITTYQRLPFDQCIKSSVTAILMIASMVKGKIFWKSFVLILAMDNHSIMFFLHYIHFRFNHTMWTIYLTFSSGMNENH